MKWIRKLFGLCQHKWRIHDEVGVYDFDSPDKLIGCEYILQCEHCGDLKVKRS